MKYPTLKELGTSRELIDVFKGYNHNLRIGDGEFYDMTNLSSDHYPVLSPRHKRGIYVSPSDEQTKLQGMVAKDALCYVADGTLYINDYPIEDMALGVSCKTCPNQRTCTKYNADDYRTDFCKKDLVSMGAYVIIMPDKKYITTTPHPHDGYYVHGDIEETITTTTSITFELCKVDGSKYENTQKQATAPKITEEMEADPKLIPLWLDTSETPVQLKQYSPTTAMWSAIATTYIKIRGTDIGRPFAVNDSVTISGIQSDSLAILNGWASNRDGYYANVVIWAMGVDYIVVTGIIDDVITQPQAYPITIARKMPNMDFIIESGNRLWGCRYGLALNGEVVNEIYASKLGDFKNWNCFMSISTDSYVASVGTDGQFTGAITHLGYPLFFKENFVHKIYGNYPANYQIQTTACRGVQKYCSKSLAIVNEVIYYKARSGICAYDGSLPVEMSSALGEATYDNAVAGALGNKYYISMSDSNGDYHLFVYDTLKGMWHREDDTQAIEFCNCRGDLYYIDYADNQIKTVRGTGTPEDKAIKWQAVTGVIGTDSPDKKYISRMDVRMKLDVGTRVMFFAEYDSCGEWEHLFTMTGTTLKTFAVPIRPQRCDHMRIKMVGEGDAKIYSICKTIEQGSDV